MTTTEAATFLNVSPNTLRAWERRFGFPSPQRSSGGHRRFRHGEIVALKDGLDEGLSISSAITRAQDGVASDSRALVSAFRGYDAARADRTVEAALAMRSVERAIEEVICPAVELVGTLYSTESAVWAFASQWACEWLGRARRMFPAPYREFSIIIADATEDELDDEAPAVRALELLLTRGGANVLRLMASCATGVGDIIAARNVDVVVLAGQHLEDEVVAQWMYAARRGATRELSLATFRRGGGTTRVAGIGTLPDDPIRASRSILQLLNARRPDAAPQPAGYELTVLGHRPESRSGRRRTDVAA